MRFAVVLALLALPGPGEKVFSGRARELDVAPPRVEAAVAIDGVLNEPVWKQAARLTGFSRYLPTDGTLADDSTDVFVWYSPTAIHFGVRAYATPGSVRATLADRDRIFMDDFVTFYLGTFNDGRQATVLSVNPLGIQSDGMLVETGSASSQAFGGLAVGREAVDQSPNFVFQSKGRVLPDGYEIEMRVPFKSLSFQAVDVQSWTVHVTRTVQSRGFEYSWAPAARGAASFLAQSGHLAGLTGLDRGLVVDVNPIVTSRVTGAAPTAGAWDYSADRPLVGGNVRWGVTRNLTLNGTARPDFAEVEADAGQFVFDPRQALFFPERRPFFLDGIEQFTTPSNLVYTRRIVSPLGAAKLTGKVAGTTVAYLGAVDDVVGASPGSTRQPLVNILRLQRDIGGQSRVGMLLASKEEGDIANRVAGADARLVINDITSLQLQGAVSQTQAPGAPARVGPLWNSNLNVSTARFGLRYVFSGIGDQFVTRTGFIGRPAIVRARADHRFTALGSAQALFQKSDFDVILDGTWRYRDFLARESAIEQKLHLTFNTTLKGGWTAGVSSLIERFGYDDRLYANYAIERRTATGRDTVPFVGIPWMGNLDWVVSVGTPQFARWSFNGFAVWGRDQNFFEWAPSDIGFASFTARWRPTDQLRTELTYLWQYYDRTQDGTRVGEGRIPRLRVEYQLTRNIFFRFVGQYTAQTQDSLRNVAGNNEPILLRNSRGVYEYARASRTNAVRADWLFSYLPVPGTVFFAGYGSSLDEDRAFAFQGLRRTQDGFFVKASYLFRL
jgi:hypothetical protein